MAAVHADRGHLERLIHPGLIKIASPTVASAQRIRDALICIPVSVPVTLFHDSRLSKHAMLDAHTTTTMPSDCAFRSTSRRVTMTVLHPSGLHTTSASLTRIRTNHLKAKREVEHAAEAQQLQHQAALVAEAALEMDAKSVYTRDDEDYERNNDFESSTWVDTEPETDTDMDSDLEHDNSAHVLRKAPNDAVFSAFQRIQMKNYSGRRRNDRWTRSQQHANMHAAWTAQLAKLTDAYLAWKHTGVHTLADAQPEAHIFHITSVDIFKLTSLSEVPQQHDELANVSLVHVGLLGCSPTFPTTAITLQCLKLYHQLRHCQSSFSIQVFERLCVPYIMCITYAPTFRDQFTTAFDAYLAILQEVQTRVDVSLGRSDLNWHLWYGCPACTFKQEDEPLLHPASLKSMDGNNSAMRMANAVMRSVAA
ncbi:hypothetical protein BU15DRAFT_74071 [Melanogaster broomeanus]|nr:hypothetical protein BU15DRAFT_74071 [Melanogaster broomeanus]